MKKIYRCLHHPPPRPPSRNLDTQNTPIAYAIHSILADIPTEEESEEEEEAAGLAPHPQGLHAPKGWTLGINFKIEI